MNEEIVKNRFEAIFSGQKAEIVKRLLGGMSNYTYVMKIKEEYYTFRIPGDYSEKFVNRDIEKENIKLMEKLGISNETIFLDTVSGEKVSKYIDGISLHTCEEFPYEKVSMLLKKIHNSGLKAVNNYNPFERLENYEKVNEDLGFTLPAEYLDLKNKFLKYKDFLLSQELVLCHGDSQPSNFIINGNDIAVVDFEFSGNNDPIYDIACFANIKLEHGLNLLNVYFDEVDDDKYNRFLLWRAFQALQWFNVATFKDLKGMSEKLKIDFKIVSNKYLALASSLIAKIHEK